MLSKTIVTVAAALALGGAFIATDAFAAHPEGGSNGTHTAGSHGAHNTGVHVGGQRGPGGHVGARYIAEGHRHVGYRGGYDNGYYNPGYGYDNGYYGPGYGYDNGHYGRGPCLPVPVPIVGCW
jgi:hypothetical protein